VAALEVADGSVAIPTFVGVFGPVHPGGVVGEVGVEMKGVQDEEDGCGKEKNGLGSLKDAGWAGGRPVHVFVSIKRRFFRLNAEPKARVQSITNL
jgi:hypothetical protein